VNRTRTGAATREELVAAAHGEPAGLRAELAAIARDDPAAGPARVADRFAAALGQRWADRMARDAPPPDALLAAVHGARREVWLWAMGERTWAHTVEALAGRLARRLHRPADEHPVRTVTGGG